MAKKPAFTSVDIIPVEIIEQRIYVIRLNEAVKRNKGRFPEDFMFQLKKEEAEVLTSQFAMSKGRGGRRTLPYAFTEHGVVMLSSVLNSDRAVQMNILIVRAFVKLRQMLATHKDLARKITDLEHQQKEHGKQLAAVYDVVKQLINPPPKPKRRMGFHDPDQKDEEGWEK